MIINSCLNPSNIAGKINSVLHDPLTVKTVAVAAATLVFISVQFSYSVSLGGCLALATSSLTILSEKFIRPLDINYKSTNWINTEISDYKKAELKLEARFRLVLLPIVVACLYGFIFLPAQGVMLAIQSFHLRTIILAILVAPISEEILFRGFLQERIEDAALLANRYIIKINAEDAKAVAQLSQSIIFGAMHIVGNQVSSLAGNIYTFVITGILGFRLSWIKNNTNGSLLPSIGMHMAHNTGITTGSILATFIRQIF